MSCGKCGKKKSLSLAAARVTKVRITCTDCSGDLVGSDGAKYPAHLTPVIVSAQQVDAWKNEGHTIQILGHGSGL